MINFIKRKIRKYKTGCELTHEKASGYQFPDHLKVVATLRSHDYLYSWMLVECEGCGKRMVCNLYNWPVWNEQLLFCGKVNSSVDDWLSGEIGPEELNIKFENFDSEYKEMLK